MGFSLVQSTTRSCLFVCIYLILRSTIHFRYFYSIFLQKIPSQVCDCTLADGKLQSNIYLRSTLRGWSTIADKLQQNRQATTKETR